METAVLSERAKSSHIHPLVPHLLYTTPVDEMATALQLDSGKIEKFRPF